MMAARRIIIGPNKTDQENMHHVRTVEFIHVEDKFSDISSLSSAQIIHYIRVQYLVPIGSMF